MLKKNELLITFINKYSEIYLVKCSGVRHSGVSLHSRDSRGRQETGDFIISQGYIVRLSFKNKTATKIFIRYLKFSFECELEN